MPRYAPGMLDRTEQRIVGVLIEKELSVPDVYPMSENALIDGCNQKSNREPVTELRDFQVAGALMALQDKGWVARIDGGGRVAKFRHRVVDRLQLDRKQLAVLAELLLRGPQAAGALKPRVARMGCHGTAEEVEAVLRGLASRAEPLVELLPLRPRERDPRWRHLLGDGSELEATVVVADSAPNASATVSLRTAGPSLADLTSRVEVLERELQELRAQLTALRGG